MVTGLLLCFLGALSFGLLGCASKLCERKHCEPSVLVVLLFAWATLVMLFRSIGLPSGFFLPFRAAAVAVVCGICAAVAYYAFQFSIGMGKVGVAWLMMNISSAIPAAVSVFTYGEKVTSFKLLAFSLALVSVYMVFRGRQADTQAEGWSAGTGRRTMWFLLMVVILVTNGMSAFGLKVIAAWGLPESAQFPYLTIWYAAGLLSIAVPALVKGVQFRKRELGWSSLLAALSIGGQLAMAAALKLNVPGHVVFPIAMGGSVLIVMLGGRLLFKERMNGVTAVGFSFGIVAVVLLSIS